MSLIILIIHIHFMQHRSSKIQSHDSTFIWWNHCIILVPLLNILTSLYKHVTWGHENSLVSILLGFKYHGLSVTPCTLYIHFFNQYCTSVLSFATNQASWVYHMNSFFLVTLMHSGLILVWYWIQALFSSARWNKILTTH